MKKVLILSGSPRKDGNSDLLCSEFMRGAQESGNEVQKIFVRSKKIVPCNACYYCRDHGGKCALNDDMSEILDAMQAADVIVMASPVYFYSIDAQMKIIIDRSLARWTNIPNKEFYFIMTCADDNRARKRSAPARNVGRRPMMFTTNGFETYFWDDKTSPQRPVSGIFRVY